MNRKKVLLYSLLLVCSSLFLNMALDNLFRTTPSALPIIISSYLNSDFDEKTVYVFDDFQDYKFSKKVWMLEGKGSCLSESHLNKETNKYLTLGQASRPGQCIIEGPKSNKYMTFTTLPFDRRDAHKVPFISTVDFGKGGSETRDAGYYLYNPDTYQGWDPKGEHYFKKGNNIFLELDFSIKDISILKERLANSFTIFQFHNQKIYNDKSCGEYFPGLSPSPTMLVELDKEKEDYINFEFRIAAVTEKAPLGFEPMRKTCRTGKGSMGTTKETCHYLLWKGSYHLKEILSQWISLQVSFNPSYERDGTIQLSFGKKGSGTDSQNKFQYKKRLLTNGEYQAVGMTLNNKDCGLRTFIGNYVFGYPNVDPDKKTQRSPLYGFYRSYWLNLPNSATREEMVKACDEQISTPGHKRTPYEPQKHRLCLSLKNQNYVTNEFKEKYNEFFTETPANKTPPQLKVSYDNIKHGVINKNN